MAKKLNDWVNEMTDAGFSDDVKNWPKEKGASVVANPTLDGTEDELTGLEVDGVKYAVPEQEQADWNESNTDSKAYIKNKPTINSVTANPTLDGTEDNLNGIEIDGVKYAIPQGGGGTTTTSKPVYLKATNVGWFKTLSNWTGGYTKIKGCDVWRDGEKTYWNSSTLNPEEHSLESNRLLSVYEGENVWSDGKYLYLSEGNAQNVLDITNNTYTAKTWTGINTQYFYGRNVWTDGKNIYMSNAAYGTRKLVNGSWVEFTFNGHNDIGGYQIWSDGENIYYNFNFSGTTQSYKLNKETNTWEDKTWVGLTAFLGSNVWRVGDKVYYSEGSNHYLLDKETDTWNPITFVGATSFNGEDIWTDGKDIYLDDSTQSLKFVCLNDNDLKVR